MVVALVVTCGLTRFTGVFPCNKSLTRKETTKILLEEQFSVNGPPKKIDSDEDFKVYSDTGWCKRILGALTVQVSTEISYSQKSGPLCDPQIQGLKWNARV